MNPPGEPADVRPPRRLPHLSPARLARLRRLFRLLGAASPSLAARILVDRFQRPGRRRRLDAADAATLARASLRTLQAGRHALQLYTWGSGPRTALLLHGWGSHAPRWSQLVEALLEEGWRVVAFDAPAHGRSSGARANLLDFRAALDAVTPALGPIDAIVAHSFGALAVASRLADTPPLLQPQAIALISTPQDAGCLLDLYLDLVDASNPVRARVRRTFIHRFSRPAEDFSAIAGAGAVSMPALVVHDEEDETVPVSHAHRLADALPFGQLHVTSGLGHNRLLRDATTLAAIVAFLGRTVGRRTARDR